MLLSAKINSIPEKENDKQNLVCTIGLSNSKKVFILLAEAVILHVEPIAVEARGLSLEIIPRW